MIVPACKGCIVRVPCNVSLQGSHFYIPPPINNCEVDKEIATEFALNAYLFLAYSTMETLRDIGLALSHVYSNRAPRIDSPKFTISDPEFDKSVNNVKSYRIQFQDLVKKSQELETAFASNAAVIMDYLQQFKAWTFLNIQIDWLDITLAVLTVLSLSINVALIYKMLKILTVLNILKRTVLGTDARTLYPYQLSMNSSIHSLIFEPVGRIDDLSNVYNDYSQMNMKDIAYMLSCIISVYVFIMHVGRVIYKFALKYFLYEYFLDKPPKTFADVTLDITSCDLFVKCYHLGSIPLIRLAESRDRFETNSLVDVDYQYGFLIAKIRYVDMPELDTYLKRHVYHFCFFNSKVRDLAMSKEREAQLIVSYGPHNG